MKPYPRYKTTGLAWLPAVPEHWEATKIRTVFTERTTKVSDKEYPPLSVSKGGVVPQIETVAKSDDGDNRKLVRIGDFVINSRSDRKGSSGVSELDGSVSLVNLVLKPRKQGNGRFLHYLLKSDPFVEEFYRNGHGIVADLWTTRYSEMKSIYIPLPPPPEQERIVRYLDEKTAAIDELVRAKEREIELLRERKQALISKAVTGGLDPATERKDSGIPWIGKIPKGWDVVKIKRLFHEVDERNIGLNAPLLSFSRTKGIIPFTSAFDKPPSASDLSLYKIVRPGLLLENRLQAWSGMFAAANIFGCVSPDYSVFQPAQTAQVKFYEYVFRSSFQVEQFANASRGVGDGFNRLYTPQFGAIETVLPPLDEQNRIVQYLDETTASINNLLQLKERELELLQELRTRLVSDAVTGAVEV